MTNLYFVWSHLERSDGIVLNYGDCLDVHVNAVMRRVHSVKHRSDGRVRIYLPLHQEELVDKLNDALRGLDLTFEVRSGTMIMGNMKRQNSLVAALWNGKRNQPVRHGRHVSRTHQSSPTSARRSKRRCGKLVLNYRRQSALVLSRWNNCSVADDMHIAEVCSTNPQSVQG